MSVRSIFEYLLVLPDQTNLNLLSGRNRFLQPTLITPALEQL